MEKKESEKKNLCRPEVLRDLFSFGDIRSIDALVSNGIITPIMAKERGRMVRRYDKDEATKEYIAYLKGKSKHKSEISADMNDEARKLKADADLKEAKAEIEQMRRDELNGQLHSSDDVKTVMSKLVVEIRGQLLALPGTCAIDCAAARTAKEAETVVKNATLEILKDLQRFQYNKKEFKKLVRQRTEWMNEGEAEE